MPIDQDTFPLYQYIFYPSMSIRIIIYFVKYFHVRIRYCKMSNDNQFDCTPFYLREICVCNV